MLDSLCSSIRFRWARARTPLGISNMIAGVNIFSGKASIASINGAGRIKPFSEGLMGWSPLRKLLGSKEHLQWLRKDLNVAKIIIVKTLNAQKINVNGITHVQRQC